MNKILHLNKRDKILYTVQPDRHELLSKIDENYGDPIINDFLNFIADDMKKNSKHVSSINQTLLQRIESLVADVGPINLENNPKNIDKI